MENFQLDQASGKFIVVEPYEKSTVLQAEEIATVFKVLSVGNLTEDELLVGELIIVFPKSVEKTMMGQTEVFFIRDTDVIAKVKLG